MDQMCYYFASPLSTRLQTSIPLDLIFKSNFTLIISLNYPSFFAVFVFDLAAKTPLAPLTFVFKLLLFSIDVALNLLSRMTFEHKFGLSLETFHFG